MFRKEQHSSTGGDVGLGCSSSSITMSRGQIITAMFMVVLRVLAGPRVVVFHQRLPSKVALKSTRTFSTVYAAAAVLRTLDDVRSCVEGHPLKTTTTRRAKQTLFLNLWLTERSSN